MPFPYFQRQLAALKLSSGYSLWFNISANERQAIWVLLVTALSLTALDYLCDPRWLAQCIQMFGGQAWALAFEQWWDNPNSILARKLYWASANIACYILLPLLTIRFVLRQPLADFGVRWQGALDAYPIYLLMLAVMLPIVWYVSTTSSFLSMYPFLRLPNGSPLWPTFFWWEVLYCAQFFALEFFFRGFLLHGLVPQIGRLSVLVMMVPYCMLHFGKPLPETLAAILAGLVLGTLSLKSRSILLGGMIHFSVALTMDLLALWRKGLLF